MEIPDAVLGAAVGSFITFVGVVLSNRASHKRLSTQLEHEANERKNERELNVKKEIYLTVTEEVTQAKAFLMKLAHVDFEQDDGMSTGAAIAKVHVIGNEETISAVIALSTYLAKGLFTLIPEKLPIDNLKSEIKNLTELIDNNSQKRELFLNEMTAYNLRGEQNKNLWDGLQGNFDFQMEQFEKFNKERTEKYQKINQLTKELTLKCVKILNGLYPLEAEAIRCVRAELGMPINIENYKNNIAQVTKEMEAEFAKFLVRIPN